MSPEWSNLREPFSAGSCDSAIHDGVLMVNYARSMYNGHQSVILWNEQIDYFRAEAFYMVVSAQGKVLTPATSLGKNLPLNSDEAPIYHDGTVYWACSYRGSIHVMKLNVQ